MTMFVMTIYKMLWAIIPFFGILGGLAIYERNTK